MFMYSVQDYVKLTAAPELVPGKQAFSGITNNYLRFFDFVLATRRCQ